MEEIRKRVNARFLCIYIRILRMWNNRKKTFLLTFSLIAVFGVLFFFSGDYVWASEITSDRVIQLVNESRISHNTEVLVRSDLLTSVAQMKIDDMFAKGYFAHTSPEGKTPWVWFEKAGYEYEYAGENLAIHFTQAEAQHQAWMESESHRKNILKSEYKEIGVAVRRGILEGQETIVTVQEFGVRAGVISKTPGKTLSVEENLQNVPLPSLTVPSSSFSLSQAASLNQAYERLLLLFWGVMTLQVIILVFMVFRFQLREKFSHDLVKENENEEHEHNISVRIVGGKM